MSLFRSEPSFEERMARAQAERCAHELEIRKAGPDQPCMSIEETSRTQCATGHPAGTPHQHRSVHWGRRAWEWGKGHGNPFEDDWRQATNDEWLRSAPLRDANGNLPDPRDPESRST